MRDTGATLLSRLTAAVGNANVLTAPTDTEPYLVDWRGRYRGAAQAIVRPASTEEVAAVVRICADEGAAIVPQGGNTSMCGAATPDPSGKEVVVSLARMNRIRALDRDNATFTVEAGVTLAAAQQAAADAGLFFPLSLAAEGSCTIGGNLSTNAGGTAVLRFGNTRDFVLGIEAVVADGRVWNGLRALRKDNTGYDLKQLFIGGEGTLGIVTAAVLKLYPSPRTRVTAFAAVADVARAIALRRHMSQAVGDRLTGFELIGDFALSLSRKHHPALPDPLPGHPWYALLQIDDAAAQSAQTAVEEALASAAEVGLVLDATVAQTQDQADKLWALRENVSEGQRREGPNIKHDISLPVSAIPEFLERAERALRDALPSVRFVIFGHLGDGNLHYNLSGPGGGDAGAFMANEAIANRIVYDLVDQARGSISAEHGIGQLKRAELARYKSEIEIELMRRIKTAFDPRGLFNPGKVL
jgi:FAD/FMN-containing dehydrogenase